MFSFNGTKRGRAVEPKYFVAIIIFFPLLFLFCPLKLKLISKIIPRAFHSCYEYLKRCLNWSAPVVSSSQAEWVRLVRGGVSPVFKYLRNQNNVRKSPQKIQYTYLNNIISVFTSLICYITWLNIWICKFFH